ncbi:DUF4198 domain-containing protein [Hymenobacter volaticus]|uniref:DUF4198 domain-containing protein n=1 Tax=Hymenobacter volaticus TaxID=2932254 RepID=A0ABY4G2L3_9BACT|nr:DUF4198 domain-containing protein [Hymenobacter volaticus]UOQ65058.1 DUF4198 domain-containing protein [Hymenobacter volaticus]
MPTTHLYKKYAAVLFFATAAFMAAAHEFWLMPLQSFVAPGTTLNLPVFVGENFTGQRWAGKSSRVTRLVHYTPLGVEDLLAKATTGDTLQPNVTFAQPGTHMVVLATNNAFITLEAEKFNAYLKEDGLDYILLQRQQRGALNIPGREAYSRCTKLLVQVGNPVTTDTARAWSRPTGMPLELVPEQNPYTLRVGNSLTIRVLADGQPKAGQLVQVWQRSVGQPVKIIRLYSNQNGRVLFRLSNPGQFMVSAVRMVTTKLPEADWQSNWSTLTFGFRGISSR